VADAVYIAVEGVIGVGKTTLARLLQPEFDAHLALEEFEENPFLRPFYKDPVAYAFKSQVWFMLNRFEQQKRLIQPLLGRQNIVGDSTFAKNYIFARVTLQGDEFEMYRHLHGILADKTSAPNLVVLLTADTSRLLERIARRDRSYESTITADYLDRLRGAYDDFFLDHPGVPVLEIDTNDLNPLEEEDHRREVIARVRAALAQS
jgi:deoxyguanosine kinase